MVAYIRKRAGAKVNFEMNTQNHPAIIAMISPPLFDWVIENLLKNALDAMEGHGHITISFHQANEKILIDITDTGKGIAVTHFKKFLMQALLQKNADGV